MKGSENNGQYSKIDKNTTLKGNVNADSDIRIDGRVEGELITTGKIILGKHAQVKGKIRCSWLGHKGDNTSEHFLEKMFHDSIAREEI